MRKIKKEIKVLTYLKKLKKKEKILLFISILIFTFIIIQECLVRPLDNEQVSLQKQISKYKSDKEDIDKKLEQMVRLNEDLRIISDDYSKAIKRFPKTEKQADVIKDLINTSNLSGVKLANVDFKNNAQIIKEDKNNSGNNNSKDDNAKDDDLLKQDDSQKNDIKSDREDDILKNDITITVNGDFKGIVSFIKRIEDMPRKISVSEVNIDDGLYGANNKDNLRAVINANYYNLNYKEQEKYDFNKGKFGKENYFK
ncbi:type 4a pilus biogenesis protein PilO [Clostridium baratii]|uniref:Pilus assembly protein, PilO n=1 Tax=Clostridium baratii TaxID=1561 RepID=A0A174RFB0_9CLOT|nr:type 4a pilus biogenesis protein PilO [Clostridium baratii]CUP82841.1 Pilus assembly protein%2C PilO [Clostridium baratii]